MTWCRGPNLRPGGCAICRTTGRGGAGRPIFAAPAHPYTRALIGCIPQEDGRVAFPPCPARWPCHPMPIQSALPTRKRGPAARQHPPCSPLAGGVACSSCGQYHDRTADPYRGSVETISVGRRLFAGPRAMAVRDVSLSVGRGEWWASSVKAAAASPPSRAPCGA